MTMAKRAEETVPQLRRLARQIRSEGRSVLFVENDCPFVDKACEAIEHGSTLDADTLSALVYYIADMMEE